MVRDTTGPGVTVDVDEARGPLAEGPLTGSAWAASTPDSGGRSRTYTGVRLANASVGAGEGYNRAERFDRSGLPLRRQDSPGQFLTVGAAAKHDRLRHVLSQGREERVREAVMRVADVRLAQIGPEFASDYSIDWCLIDDNGDDGRRMWGRRRKSPAANPRMVGLVDEALQRHGIVCIP